MKLLRCLMIVFALASFATAQNLVLNPSFEGGSFAPWVNNNWFLGSGSAHTGSAFSSTGCVGGACITPDPSSSGAWFYQNLTTTPGSKYTLTFWFYPGPQEGPGDIAELQVLWGPSGTPLTVSPGTCGGNCVYRNTTIGSSTFTQITVNNLTATSASTRLEFLGRQDPDDNAVDDVSVTLASPGASTPPAGAPALTTWGLVALALGLLIFGGRHLAGRTA
jgi:hypothetical protein